MISLGVIITSVTCLCAETVFDSECDDTGCHEMEVPPGFATTELICIIWFTTEYLLRFLASRNKCKFLKNTMNVIDKLAIAPFYITAIVKLMNPDGGGGGPFAIVRVIRLIRIFRVFKLGKHSSGLVVLTRTVRLPPLPLALSSAWLILQCCCAQISGSMNELMLLLFFLAMGMLVFATAVYYCEHGRVGEGIDNYPVFESIPHGFWWAIVTMTTLGYGDLYPVTPAGMIVGSVWCASNAQPAAAAAAACCLDSRQPLFAEAALLRLRSSITGVLMIALPMVVIGQNFADHYSQMRMEEQEREAEAEAARLEEKGESRPDQSRSRVVGERGGGLTLPVRARRKIDEARERGRHRGFGSGQRHGESGRRPAAGTTSAVETLAAAVVQAPWSFQTADCPIENPFLMHLCVALFARVLLMGEQRLSLQGPSTSRSPAQSKLRTGREVVLSRSWGGRTEVDGSQSP